MYTFTTVVPRAIALVAGLGIGALVISLSFENGLTFAPGLMGQVSAVGFACATIATWFLPAIARTTERGIGLMLLAVWLGGTAFVVMNGVRITATHLDENVGNKTDQMADYDLAISDAKRLTGELATAKTNETWNKTSGCTAGSLLTKSEIYCKNVQKLKDDLAKAKETIKAGRPKSADSGGERLSVLLRLSQATVDVWWPIIMSIVMDIMATACMTAAFAPIRGRKQQLQYVQLEPIEAPAWLSSAEIPDPKRLARYRSPFRFGIDGRLLRHLPTKMQKLPLRQDMH